MFTQPKIDTSEQKTTLKRTAFIDHSDDIPGDLPTVDEVVDSKGPLLDRNSSGQIIRDERRHKLNHVVMLEIEIDENKNPIEKPMVVTGVGPNLSKNGLDNKINRNSYHPEGNLDPKAVQKTLKRVYFDMMLVAANNGAQAFVTPLLSTSYYAGNFKDKMIGNKETGDKGISKEAFDEATQEFRSKFPESQLTQIVIARNSLPDAKKLADTLKCSLSKIAVGIAGADNSGTGATFREDTLLKFERIAKGEKGKDLILPHEEWMKGHELVDEKGDAFNRLSSYMGSSNMEIKYINGNEITHDIPHVISLQ